jgi:RNA polymerase sigma-70 factor (ECF subfamily)
MGEMACYLQCVPENEAKRDLDQAESPPARVGARVGRTQAEVLRAAAAGESWAHEELYDALYPFVARALQRILHGAPEYEDLVQTAFEQIVRALQRTEAARIENLAAWSSTIAARVALNALRARVRERRFFDREVGPQKVLDLVADPRRERELEVRGDLLWLQRALVEMNADQAEAVLLHDVLGHDLWEVAGLTGVSPAAAQKRLSRGHIELKRLAARRNKGEAS